MTNNIQTKAQELVNSVLLQIAEERENLAKRMLELGYTPESHIICDNIIDAINDPSISYKCWAELKPRMNRGENDGTI